MSQGIHPEVDDSELLNEGSHQVYQQLMGSLQWLCMIGRADIQYAVCSLSRFLAAPRVKN